jgi:ATP phosphoribosyltransferase
MLYKFKSAATGDLIMLGATGNQLLLLLGREPASKGIFEVDDMPALITALQAAIFASDSASDSNNNNDGAAEAAAHANDLTSPPSTAKPAQADADSAPTVSLRQRLWPMLEMLRSAHAARAVVVWGV